MANTAKHAESEAKNNLSGKATQAGSGGTESAETIADLRATLASLANEVSTIVEQRSRAAASAAAEAVKPHVDTVQQSIRSQPVISMALAAGLGALLAVALVPRAPRQKTLRERWVPNVTRADLNNLADQLSSAVSRLHVPSMPAMPDTSSFERVLSKLAHADPTGPMSNAFDKIAEWALGARKKVNGNGRK
ncbi:hypothetical protein APY04_0072 [Hyphomicrobium sulfonivorans]|uniref:DUF3618 domain-containing protein n=1 Tax=Hyphomicrobium sulfonivorans TaxID=121290 RepID=A0A109BPN3_HYPSL|nr:hypothetical protein [Hyphomicrobium sulfonivorans]KWT72633.1 hypothetical protein APY04_0072 [Hyphomicrobium sulfonivorans]